MNDIIISKNSYEVSTDITGYPISEISQNTIQNALSKNSLKALRNDVKSLIKYFTENNLELFDVNSSNELFQISEKLPKLPISENTLINYFEWLLFSKCDSSELENIKNELLTFKKKVSVKTILEHSAHLKTSLMSIATIKRHKASISHIHKLAYSVLSDLLSNENKLQSELKQNFFNPTDSLKVKKYITGLSAELSNADIEQNKNAKMPLKTDEIIQAVKMNTGSKIQDLRNATMVLIAFGGALRSSEVVSLKIKDVKVLENGLELTIRQHKTKKAIGSKVIFIDKESSCKAYQIFAKYLETLKNSFNQYADLNLESVLFPKMKYSKLVNGLVSEIDPTAFSHIVKNIFVDFEIKNNNEFGETLSAGSKDISSHSMRKSFITNAILNGGEVTKIAKHAGYTSLKMIMTYFNDLDKRNNSISKLL